MSLKQWSIDRHLAPHVILISSQSVCINSCSWKLRAQWISCKYQFYNIWFHTTYQTSIKLDSSTVTIRPNNLFLVCLYLSLYISFLLFGHFFHFFFSVSKLKKKKKCQNNKKEIYNDKYRHTRDKLFGLGYHYITDSVSKLWEILQGTHNVLIKLSLWTYILWIYSQTCPCSHLY